MSPDRGGRPTASQGTRDGAASRSSSPSSARRYALLAFAGAFLAIFLLASCGGSTTEGSGTEPSTSASATALGGDTTSAEASAGEEGARGESGEGSEKQGGSSQKGGGSNGGDGGSSGGSGKGSDSGSKEFVAPGGNNSIQEYGDEASASEREQASSELETYMRARAAKARKSACATLSKVALSQLQDLAVAVPGVGKGDSCVTILVAIDKQTPPSARANTMTGPIGSLRVEEDRGFALYHGTDDVNYTIQMVKEGGLWKVGGLIPFPVS